VRFDLLDLVSPDDPHSWDTIGDGTGVDGVEPRGLLLVEGDDDLAALVVRDLVCRGEVRK